MKRLVIAVLTLVIIGGVAWGWLDRSRDSTTTLGKAAAEQIADRDEPVDPAIAPGARPDPATYSYTGSGSDSFSALGGAAHEFPAQVFAVVSLDPHDPCGWTWTMPFVKEHVEERGFCTKGGAVLDTGFERTTEFIGHRQASTYECTDTAWRLPRAQPSTKRSWTWTCTEKRGGRVTYTGRTIGDEQVSTKDGSTVTATHVRIDGVQDDKSSGRERTELWLLANGLPVRFTTDRHLTVSTPLGKMTTAEKWDYRIDSLDPAEQ